MMEIQGILKVGITGNQLPEGLFNAEPGNRVHCAISGFYSVNDPEGTTDLSAYNRYKSIAELLEHSDAMVIDFHYPDALLYVEKALKSFRHVYLTSAKNIHRSDYIFLQKIAEESNVVLFPDYGVNYRGLFKNIWASAGDLIFAQIHHMLPETFPLGIPDHMFSAVLDDLSFFSLKHENLRKIGACAMGYPGTRLGMVSSRIDFDTGLSLQLLIENGADDVLTAEFFFQGEKISFRMEDRQLRLKVLNYGSSEETVTVLPDNDSGHKAGLAAFCEIVFNAGNMAIPTHHLFKNYFVAKSLMDKVSYFIPEAGVS